MAIDVGGATITLQLQILYEREADRCLAGNAYVATFVFSAASLEAALLALALLDPEVSQSREGRPLDQLGLHQLIKIGVEMGWLTAWNEGTLLRDLTPVDAGTPAEALQLMRNWAHPGNIVRGRVPVEEITFGHAVVASVTAKEVTKEVIGRVLHMLEELDD